MNISHQQKHRDQERTSRNPNFTTTILVNQSPDLVYAAINDVRGWWSEDIEGRTDTPGGVFMHRYGDMHRWVALVRKREPPPPDRCGQRQLPSLIGARQKQSRKYLRHR